MLNISISTFQSCIASGSWCCFLDPWHWSRARAIERRSTMLWNGFSLGKSVLCCSQRDRIWSLPYPWVRVCCRPFRRVFPWPLSRRAIFRFHPVAWMSIRSAFVLEQPQLQHPWRLQNPRMFGSQGRIGALRRLLSRNPCHWSCISGSIMWIPSRWSSGHATGRSIITGRHQWGIKDSPRNGLSGLQLRPNGIVTIDAGTDPSIRRITIRKQLTMKPWSIQT